MIPKKQLDLAAIRARLEGTKGKEYWQSLEELADSGELEELLYSEFPRQAAALPDGVTRRQFLVLMGASLALAGLTSCGAPPTEKIVPYVQAPELMVPDKPLYFATAMPLSSSALGLLVESYTGRPIKVEGNPDHPASLGATDTFTQASVLTLYDPDRSQAILRGRQIVDWDTFLTDFRDTLGSLRARGGEGLRILTETVTSPTLAAQLAALLEEFPGAVWHQYEPAGAHNRRAGTRLAFGEPVNTIYRFDRANVVLALDSDFLRCEMAEVRHAHDFASRRWLRDGSNEMNRLYSVESSYTTTGSKADHRLPLRASEIAPFAAALAAELGLPDVPEVELPAHVPTNWIGALARDLLANRGGSLIVVGEEQPPVVHALAHAMNALLDNVGSTVLYTDPVEAAPEVDQFASLRALTEDMAAGEVDLLLILDGNPVYTAPADVDFAAQLEQVPLSVHLSLYRDETSARTTWHVPMAHYLETWSDTRSFDGSVTLIQPLIAPLFGGKSAHEMLAALSEDGQRSSYDILRDFWSGQVPDGVPFERFWRTSLHDGIVPDSAFPERTVTLRTDWLAEVPTRAPEAEEGGLEIIFRPDPTIYDGRFANNAWLQELPKPVNKLTWDNAAFMSPRTAERLGLVNEDLVQLRYRGRTVEAPVWIEPGHADESVTVTLGYGRERAGRVGSELGYNAYALRTSEAPWIDLGLEIARTGRRYALATTQPHHQLADRETIVRAAPLERYREEPDFAHHAHGEGVELDSSLYPEWEYNGYAWGMIIDLTACTGCNACVVACQAENNIAVVGKEEVLRSREMHWLRVDTYYTGELDNPASYHMPVPCMHCEKAPCEPVCPVAATVHDDEGLNNMVYNRCVGTRYCSNNCPYKVRRFNFLEYIEEDDRTTLRLRRNPDVTVRSRGVMEKCTYCVQRISVARIEAEKEGRRIEEGEVITACAAACPTRAILFGDINNEESEVRRLREHPLNYGLLEELGTQPRTTYLAAVRNPNPELATEEEPAGSDHG